MSQKTKYKIMFVDDSETILNTAQKFLVSNDEYEIHTASDGFLALAKITEVNPDIVFMDIMMPRLDGYSACLAIKSNNDFHDLPVIMLSSKDSPFDKARGAMMGCNDYLTKPFSKESLLEIIESYLPQNESLNEIEK